RYLVEQAQVRNADGYPYDYQYAYDDAPDPDAHLEDAVGGDCAVINHDARPADELQHVQQCKEQAAAVAEAHLGGLHGALALTATDEAGEEEQHAAYDVADYYGQQTLAHAEGREVGAGEYLGQRDRRAEPDERVLESCRFLHFIAPPRRIRP